MQDTVGGNRGAAFGKGILSLPCPEADDRLLIFDIGEEAHRIRDNGTGDFISSTSRLLERQR